MTADAAPVPDVQPKAKIFISYSRKDLAFADRLEAALKARAFEPLIDRTKIYAFEDWWKRIEALIGSADTIVFVLSPDAVASDVALKEVAYAASLNKRFAPIVCRRVDDSAVPEALRRLNFVFFDDPDRFEASADKLAEALQTDIGWIRRHTEVGDIAHRWIDAGRPDGMLLRPPVLDQAEAWVAFRPGGAPAPTAETQAFIAASRKAEVAARRRSRILNAALYTMLVGIILGLIGWINQDFLIAQWRYVTVTLPYWYAHVRGHVLTAAQERGLKPGDSFKECDQDCPEMVVVPAGSFMMGSAETDAARWDAKDEEPQHNVTIAKAFAVSKYELTFAEWDVCATHGGCDPDVNDGGFGRGQQPVIHVSWPDARRYVAWLTQMTGKTYRLLSEAEYEFAARAGTQTAYPWGDEFKPSNARAARWDEWRPAPVGSYTPNLFGLYDIVGNVWEWVEDCAHNDYHGAPTDGSPWVVGGDCTKRIVRGGAWDSAPIAQVRSASRNWQGSNQRYVNLGFRIARKLTP